MKNDLLEMSVNLVTAHLTNSSMQADEVLTFIRSVHGTLSEINGSPAQTHQALPTAANSAPNLIEHKTASKKQESPQLGAKPRPIEASAPAETITVIDPIPPMSEEDEAAFHGLDPWLASRISAGIARRLDPANEIHPSLYPDKIICLEDGGEVKLLSAYIKKRFNLTPAEYRLKWNLPKEFPMTPPVYAELKRQAAIKGGLGNTIRANREKGPAKAKIVDPNAPPKKRGRPRKNPELALVETSAAPTAAPATGNRRKLTLFPQG